MGKINELFKASNNNIMNESTTTYKSPALAIDYFENKIAVSKTINNGIPFYLFLQLKDIVDFNDIEWANQLNVSTKTLERFKNNPTSKFKRLQSEKIVEFAEVLNLGLQIFDEPEQFYNWLKEPSIALGNNKPIDLLKNSYGKELVINSLYSIEHGVFV